MTPIHLDQYSHLPSSADHSFGRQAYLHPFLPTYETSLFPCASYLNPCQGGSQEGHDHQRSQHLEQEADQHFHSSLQAPPQAAQDDEGCNKNNIGSQMDPSSNGAGKWMSSKMRFMRKMMNSDQIAGGKTRIRSTVELQAHHQCSRGDANNNNNNNNGSHCLSSGPPVLRACSDCNTTKTPLWRSGPRGPKSLCNACGIRQRKARRAMAAAALSSGGLVAAVAPPAKVPKERRPADGIKKRCKFTTPAGSGKKLHVDEFTVSLGKNPAFHRVFPQDEKEAAMLLMALSCDLISG